MTDQYQDEEEQKNIIKEKYNPMLLEGARENDEKKVLEAIEYDVDLDYCDNYQWNSIMWICHNGNIELLRKLIKRGALTLFNNG